jgi:formylglycine-generating enzyme required for sulfatase activity/DNA-binding winged helix-turn-helix (wHTH) protein
VNRLYDKAEWRRAIDLSAEAEFRLGALLVRPSLCEIVAGDRAQSAEPRVMQALVVLAKAKGTVVSRDELVQRCWGGRIVSEDAINRCIAKVRRLAELDGGASFRLETVPKIGYRLIEHPVPQPPSVPDVAKKTEAGAAIPPRLAWALAIAAAILATVSSTLWFSGGASRPQPDNPAKAALAEGDADVPPAGTFRDCSDVCPEMVVVPAGKFLMGTPQSTPHGNDEVPQHAVTFAHPFAMSKYPVTRAEFARFATETGRADLENNCFTLSADGRFIETPNASWRDPGFPQTSQDPVVCMNWDDAESYAAWLSRKTGKPYRLPSEAEWEYAERAGAEGRFMATGKDPCKLLNGGDAAYHAHFPGDPGVDTQCNDGYSETSPVGSFPANAFGLFDMTGNVHQWVADCYNTTYDGAPSDGSAWNTGNCNQRINRGGAWTDEPRALKFAHRFTDGGTGRFSSVGFRLARSLLSARQ